MASSSGTRPGRRWRIWRGKGVSEATIYTWKSKYGGLEGNEAQCLKNLEEENGKLKRIVADQALDITMLKKFGWKKW